MLHKNEINIADCYQKSTSHAAYLCFAYT